MLKIKFVGKTSGAEQEGSAGTQEKRVYHLCKKGLLTHEKYKDVVRLCRQKVKKAKAQMELNLPTAIKDNKKFFFKYISNNRRAKENLHPLLHTRGNLVTEDEEMAEEHNTTFTSVFNSHTSHPQGTQFP